MNYILVSLLIALIYGCLHYSVFIKLDTYNKSLSDQVTFLSNVDSRLLIVSTGLCVSLLLYESFKYILTKNKIAFLKHPLIDIFGIMVTTLFFIYLY